jgi:hypothetical protein
MIDAANNLLLKYIIDTKPHNKIYYDYLKYDLDKFIYYYGAHYKSHNEVSNKSAKVQLLEGIKNILISLLSLKSKKDDRVKILSTAYFRMESLINNQEGNRVLITRPPWSHLGNWNELYDYDLYKRCYKIQKKLQRGSFYELISDDFIEQLKTLEKAIKIYIISNNIKAIFLAHDMGFFEKLAIKICQELEIPSFIFVHGLQFYINNIEFNRTDYLVVWGQLSKIDFIKKGFNAEKIIVSGHPRYSLTTTSLDKLKFDINNILVLTKSIQGVPYSDKVILTDRSNSLYYLYTIQNALQKIGVKQVRFRPHPSESGFWYQKYIDTNFFKLDNDLLDKSLQLSSLVIGPTSTVFLEALLAGVNYIIYEPNINDKGLDNLNVVSMYNGDNPKVPVASTEDELLHIISQKKNVDLTIMEDIIDKKFNIDEVFNIILNNERV